MATAKPTCQMKSFHADGMRPVPGTKGLNAQEKTKEPGLGMRTEKTRSTTHKPTSAPSAQTIKTQAVCLPACLPRTGAAIPSRFGEKNRR